MPGSKVRPAEGDWECAYRVLKHCHQLDHNAGAALVAGYRIKLTQGLVEEVREAYIKGDVALWLAAKQEELP